MCQGVCDMFYLSSVKHNTRRYISVCLTYSRRIVSTEFFSNHYVRLKNYYIYKEKNCYYL